MTDTVYHNLHFGICRSIRYHTYRESFLRAAHNWFLFGAFMLSIYAVIEGHHAISVASAALLGFMLVFRVNEKALLHGELKQGFIQLQQQMERSRNLQDDDLQGFLADITAQRLAIESREPQPLRVLDIVCHIEMMRAQGNDPSEFPKVSWYQRLFKQLWDIRPHTLVAQESQSV